MSIRKALLGIAAVSAVVVGMVGCGGAKTAKTTASAPAYSSVQEKPVTPAQKAAATRGVKIEKEECEEYALEFDIPPQVYRASGKGTSDDESFATNLAMLDARTNLAQQLEVLMNGAITNYRNKYGNKEGASSSVQKAQEFQSAYFEQFLKNTRPRCKNAYVKENGDYDVYVAIELDEKTVDKVYDQMSKDTELGIDFKEHQFKEEMKDMRQKYIEGKQ
jgi:hypothetical protein